MKYLITLIAASAAFAAPAFATVTVTSPANNSTVTSPVHYVATATTSTCGSGVASMGIYVNNQLEYVVNGTSLNTTLTLAPGTYYTVVEEWDHCGGATTQPVYITVGSAPTSPSGVTVTSPAPNSTVTSPIAYKASATTACSAGIGSMGIYVNNQLQYVVNGNTLNTTLSLAPGQYNTVVQDWDNCGGAGKTSIPITVVNAPSSSGPGVVVTSPANNSTVSSPVTYTASATTSCAKGVASMGIYVNNQLQYVQNGSTLSTSLTLATGSYYTVVQEWDNCGGALKTPINITVSSGKTLSSVSVSPNPVSLAVGGSQQLTATAHYSDGTSADVTSSATWSVASSAVATVNSTGVASGVAAGSTTITASYSGATSSVPVNVGVASGTGVSVLTWHFDNNRSGLNPSETSLTPTTVNAKSFGKLFSYLVDGYVYGEPLLVSNLSINGGTHNVVYAATENDSVYAFDADSYGTGAPLWKTSLLHSGETPVTTAPIKPVQGVTSTPVIDRSTNTIYVISEQTSSSGGTFRLNALDITTGAQKFGGPVTLQASVPGTNASGSNGVVSLNTSCMQRAALLLANGNVYIGFGGCATGWLLAYNAQTLAKVGVFNASPNLNGTGAYASAGGIWMGSGGPVADSAGNIYVVTGNGPWDGKTAWSDSVLKFSPSLQLEDSFTPQDYGFLGCDDEDLAAGGVMMIPGTSKVITGGKMGKLYLLNTGNLGKEQANDAGAAQTLWFESDLSAPYPATCTSTSGSYSADISSYEIFGTAAYYNGYAYLGITPTASSTTAGVRQFAYSGTLTPGAYTTPSIQQNTRGTTPFISSNGSSGGVLWMIDTGQPLQGPGTPTAATLRAYDADAFPNALYNSSTNSGDIPGYGIKFTSPVVANGKVYMSTGHDAVTATNPRGEIDVYGLK